MVEHKAEQKHCFIFEVISFQFVNMDDLRQRVAKFTQLKELREFQIKVHGAEGSQG